MLPRWLSWVVLGFLGYLIVLGTNTPHEQPTSQSTTPVEAAKERALPALSETLDIERWKRALNPAYAKQVDCELPAQPEGMLPMSVTQEAGGDGAGASCGDTVRIALTVWDRNGKPAYQSKFELLLGARAIAVGIDNGLLGLRPNGVRTLVLPPAALTRVKTPGIPPALLAALPAMRVAIVTITRLPDAE